jgi:hypothetical protein
MKYEWRFDKRGRRTTPASSAADMSTASASTRSPQQELEAVREWISHHPGDAVNFDSLERLQVLSSPPAWSYVQGQLNQLRDAANEMSAETRAQLEESISAYFNGLRNNAEPL